MSATSGFCAIFDGPPRAGANGRGTGDSMGSIKAAPSGTLTASADRRLHATCWQRQGRPAAAASEGSQAVLLHGELDNRQALAEALGLDPAATGAAVLLAGWRRWSTGLFERLDGVVALAVRDGDRLALYRDPSGLSELYLQADGERLILSTDLGTLAGLPGSVVRLGPHTVQEYLRFLEIAAPGTVYDGIAAVEEGTVLQWPASAPAAPAASAAASVPGRAAAASAADELGAAVDELDTLLNRSIRAQLADAARPAAFLSGGIDSALLCAIAARQRPELTAVTVGFDDASLDEAPLAGRIAAHLGIAHQVVRFDRAAHIDALARLGTAAGQPMADPSAPSTLLAFEHCHRHFDAVLDGSGADEALGLMPPRHARVAVAWSSLMPPRLRAGLARALRATPPLAGYARLLDFAHPLDTLTRWNGFGAAEIAALTGSRVDLAGSRMHRVFARFPRHAHFERYSALVDAMGSTRLSQGMALAGCTVRFPFWSRDTNRFLRQLRPDLRWLPGQPKRILRALLARYVPAPIWDQPKRGFTFPLHDFLACEDHHLVRRYLRAAAWHDRGWLSAAAVDDVARRFIAGDTRLLFRVWGLVVLGAWLEGHGEPRP